MEKNPIPAILTKSEFADYLGLMPSYITALVKAGRIVLDGEGRSARVKVAESLALIESTHGGRFDVARRHAAARRRAPNEALASTTPTPLKENAAKRDSESPESEKLVDAKTRKESAQADQEEMKAAEMAGSLVRVQNAKLALLDAGATVRSLCDVFADQHTAELSAMSGMADVHAYLSDCMRQFLTEFCGRLEKLELELKDSRNA